MDWQLELIMAAQTILAALLGALIGWERERHGTEAGIRTHMAVSIGACTYALVSSHVPGADPTRIASQVVVGIGFIGAGVIINQRGTVSGLTTAAALWATSAMGVASAFGMYTLAILTAVLIYTTLALHHLPWWDRLAKGRTDTASKPRRGIRSARGNLGEWRRRSPR
jgi:putative Mg2+ transporter-C (MgtC) family protein